MLENANRSGAVASNAGDDFHLIWAGKKLLTVLKPNTELMAVTVEGPAWEDSVEIEDEHKLYSIDLAEYYGGKSFDEASLVIFSQLKYSAYQMERPWTTASLCAASDVKKTNSIIRRLADTYVGYYEKYHFTQEKLVLKLVSNRSLSVELQKHVTECRIILERKLYKCTASLLNQLSDECKKDIDLLYKTSGLPSTLFPKFLLALDFSDCGTGVRSIHKAELMKQLCNWGLENVQNGYNNLIMYIRECMLPERAGIHTLDKNHVRVALGVNSRDIFPAEAKLEPFCNKYIERESNTDLVKEILRNGGKTICIHAMAGAGKTTFIRHLQNYLPQESVVLVYDCYGAGTFLQPDKPRHLTEVAVTQICNTLAVECGTEMLLGKPQQEYEWWRCFMSRLEHAVQIVKAQNPSAVVVLVIDAADNCMQAAETYNSPCFLSGLLNLSLPEGVFLLVTARTERWNKLPLQREKLLVELPVFTLPESTAYLHNKFDSVTEAESEEFHLLTGGNPRVQSYLLSSAECMDEVLSLVRPNGKDLILIFEQFIKSAEVQYESMVNIAVLFYALTNLPRPIPIEIICDICEISESTLRSLCVECHLGIYIAEEKISFRDEDFESFLLDRYGYNTDAIQRIADYMYENRNKHSYCMRYAHFFVNRAEHFERIIQLALEDTVEVSGVGVAQISQIMKQRIQCALKRPELRKEKKRSLACKLIYQLINYIANEETLRQMFYDGPDEVLLYCDELSAINVFQSRQDSFEALGKAAFVFSAIPSCQVEGERNVDIFIIKMSQYYKEKRDNWQADRPRTQDFVNIAEALVRLGREKEAWEILCGWIPQKVATGYVFQFFKKMLWYGREWILQPLFEYSWSLPNMLAIVAAYLSMQQILPENFVRKLKKAFTRMERIPESRFDITQVVQFWEYMFSRADEKETVNAWIKKFDLDLRFQTMPSLFDEREKEILGASLGYYALRSVCCGEDIECKDLWKDTDHSKEKKKQSSKNTEINRLEFLFPIYIFRVNCIGMQGREKLIEAAKEELKRIERFKWQLYTSEYTDQKVLEEGIGIFLGAICLSAYTTSSDINMLVDKALKVQKVSLRDRLNIARKMVGNKLALNTVIRILEDANDNMTKYPFAAGEMASVYLSCAQIGHRVDIMVGKKYFQRAIECTHEVDYHSYHKIFLFYVLAQKLGNQEYQNAEAAYKLACVSESFLTRMDDTKNFPYEQALSAVALLDKEGVWSSLCRMDDRNYYYELEIQDTLPIVLESLWENKYVEAEDVVALSALLIADNSRAYNHLVDIVLMRMKTMPPARQKGLLKILIRDVLYNVPMMEKGENSQRLVTYLDSVVTIPELDTSKIREMSKFLQRLDSKKERASDIVSKVKATVDEIADFSLDSKTGVKKILELENKESKGKLLKAWLDIAEHEQYTQRLEDVLDILAEGGYRYNIAYFLGVIADFVIEQKKWPDIEDWRTNPAVHRKYYHAFAQRILTSWREQDIYISLRKIFLVSDEEQYSLFLEYIANNAPDSTEQLVHAACIMTNVFSVEDSEQVLSWSLEKEYDLPCSAYRTINEYEFLRNGQPKGLEGNIAQFLWKMLGHPDKKKRGRAIHVLLRYISLGKTSMLKYFPELYAGANMDLYMDEGNYFFVESARIWYLAVCLYIVREHPEILVEQYNFFESVACHSGVIHALQRQYAKRICILLASSCENADLQKVYACSRCKEGRAKELRRYQREIGMQNPEWKFSFDTTDTLRYWYDDVAELFGCTQEEVADVCDYYVAEFGITDGGVKVWNDKYFQNIYYGRGSNDHGSLPSFETLKRYAEWHSMFYVADYFRQKRCLSEGNEDYEEWLNRYLPNKDGYWGFEFRSYIPFIPVLWKCENNVDEKDASRYVIPNHFIEEIVETGLGISLGMEQYAHFQYGSQYINISGMAIKEENIVKFVNVLKKDPHAFYDYLYSNEERYGGEADFYVYPLCEEITTFSERAIDYCDPLAKGYLDMSNYIMGVSGEIFPELGKKQLEYSMVESDEERPVHTYHWAEPEEESGYEKRSVHGYLVCMEKEYLLNILQQQNFAAMFRVRVSFEDDEYRYQKVKHKAAKAEALFVLTKDGTGEVVMLREE